MNSNVSEVYSFCGENVPSPISIDKLIGDIKSLGNKLSAIAKEIKTNDPIEIPNQIQIPGIKLIKVGLTPNRLEDQIRKLQVNADLSSYVSSSEDLHTIANSSISLYKRGGKNAIPKEIVKLCKGYLGGSVPENEFYHQISIFRLQQSLTQMENLKNQLKNPTESSWQDTDELDGVSNYSYNDPDLLDWLAAGGNYGVVAGSFKDGNEILGRMVLIDLDDYDRVQKLGLLEGWPETFTVKTGRRDPAGRHLYYLVSDVPEGLKGKIKLWEADHELGEIKLNASQCVGPGSWHPSGRRYEVVNPAEIAVISWEKIQELADKCQSSGKTQQVQRSAAPGKKSKRVSWEDKIRTEWILFPDPIVEDGRDGSGWVKGLSPIHPVSQHGANLSVNVKTNEWHCWVCEHSGGPLEALAVINGLIECDQITTGWRKENPDVWKAVLQLARESWPDLVPENVGYSTIPVTARQLHEISEDAMAAIVAANNPPKVFKRAGCLQRVKEVNDKRYALDSLDEKSLRGIMSRTARYIKITEDSEVDTKAPSDVARDILSMEGWPGLPSIEAIIEAPVIRSDGTILVTEGYDEVSRLYYIPAPGLQMPEIPEEPAKEEAEEAAKWIMDEVLVDFPFVDEASKANALAAMLTPLIRPAISGVVPMALIDKPQAGTGASLLMEATAIIATGKHAEMISQPETEDEWRKNITSNLMAGNTLMCFDNVDRKLKASTLSRALSSLEWRDRILGQSEMTTMPNRATWMATGNNLLLGGDVARRSYWIRMDAKQSQPWTRDTFKHEDLTQWVKEHRGEILAKLLIMVRAWFAAGCPKPKEKLPVIGGFQQWTKTVGSIMAFAGVQKFLGNLSDLYDQADTEAKEWQTLLQIWHGVWGDKFLTVADILLTFREGKEFQEALPHDVDAILSRGGKSASTSLGIILKKHDQVRYPCGLHLELGINNHSRQTIYKVCQ
jgi:hypothetical protein